MSADRQIPNSTTIGAVTGNALMDDAQEEFNALYDACHLPLALTSVTVSGSPEGTAIVAVIPVPLTGSLIHGMKFTLTMGATGNTGPATLDVDGTDRDVLRYNGDITETDDLAANAKIPLEWDGDENAFYILTPPAASKGAVLDRQVFTSSGTWTKPSGLDDEAQVRVEAWGAGGGGSSGSDFGGGGGAYRSHIFRAGELSDTVAVTIGAGGATNAAGGNTTFGSYLTAYGGAGGTTASNSGGGGGMLGAGSGATGGGPLGGTSGGASAFGGGGGTNGTAVGGASAFGGGGGGGAANGGASEYGGGGGAGSGGTTGGASKFGGAGGNTDAAGSPPGGGGGRGGVGARGELRVRVIG